MADSFIGKDFLLHNDPGRELYQHYASSCAIIDYHNHLSPKDIAENRKFENLTAIWLEGDHYKWRAMRINGIAEEYCTGKAEPQEKFRAWARTVPATLRNPLYHWTHLELKTYFGINSLLNEQTADAVYEQASAMLQHDDFRVQALLRKMNVQVVCTTDDPIDSLIHHEQVAEQENGINMFPTFRPDKVYNTIDPQAYATYISLLGNAAGISIQLYDDLIQALSNRIDYFDSFGCRASDHGLESIGYTLEDSKRAQEVFKKVSSGVFLTRAERFSFQNAVLYELGKLYHKKGWIQQFHLGAMRNNNTRLLHQLGPDTGFDSIGDYAQARGLSDFLNQLDQTNQLAKTILYNLNPADNEVFATMVGNFSDGSVPGKIQWGSAWWFLDQKDGMEKQLNTLSNMGLLSRFVGMVTDSRSFLSFPRHEYFRRILCNLIGEDVRRGVLPNDLSLAGQLVQDVCYNNVHHYFQFQV
ncbi:MAG: glucuronate isomerase [Cyclobacteriaceae bacterium]|nr:glucuronate isomerase [Cyclobacteriaceae bacterium]